MPERASPLARLIAWQSTWASFRVFRGLDVDRTLPTDSSSRLLILPVTWMVGRTPARHEPVAVVIQRLQQHCTNQTVGTRCTIIVPIVIVAVGWRVGGSDDNSFDYSP